MRNLLLLARQPPGYALSAPKTNCIPRCPQILSTQSTLLKDISFLPFPEPSTVQRAPARSSPPSGATNDNQGPRTVPIAIVTSMPAPQYTRGGHKRHSPRLEATGACAASSTECKRAAGGSGSRRHRKLLMYVKVNSNTMEMRRSAEQCNDVRRATMQSQEIKRVTFQGKCGLTVISQSFTLTQQPFSGHRKGQHLINHQ